MNYCRHNGGRDRRGWWYNSMALLADGWNKRSDAVAIGLSAMAYAASRRYASAPRFAFGTWKIEVLSGFASAIFLLGATLTPTAIRYRLAIHKKVVHSTIEIHLCPEIKANMDQPNLSPD